MKIAILGGGQLARMMVLEAHRLGLNTQIFCYSNQEPAAAVTQNVSLIQATAPYFNDENIKVLKTCTHLTFESEFFLADSLKSELKALKKLKVFPRLDALKKLQYRLSQKKMLDQHHVATAPWVTVTSFNQAVSALNKFGAMVIKKPFGGYDGYGTFVVKSTQDLDRLNSNPDFFKSPLLCEQKIVFKRELAMTFVRSASGQTISLPLVESYQTDNRCDWVIGPVTHKNIKGLVNKIKPLLDTLGYVGAISFELFDTGDKLLVNEVAPRVHNSAHYSLDALSFNQFELHLMSAYLKELPSPGLISPNFLMLNLIGQKDLVGLQSPRTSEGSLHWYGKTQSRVGRKLGHLNLIDLKGQKPQQLLNKGLKLRSKLGF